MIFSTRTDLMAHQREAVAKLLPARVGALFMDMGTGKSRTAMELARVRSEKIDRVIWFCPVSLKETIRRQILLHTNCSPDQIYVFGDRTNERNVPLAFWYVVGLESISGSTRVVCAARTLITERSMVIVDESSYIKGHRALRTNRITQMAQTARYRLVLTGTPITQGIQDLFAQMRFLSSKILGYYSFYSFAANHLEYSNKYKGMIVRAHNAAWIAAKIRPYVYQVTKAECLDLPNKIYGNRTCPLTQQQDHYYALAKERFYQDVMEYDDGDKWKSSLPIFRLFSALQGVVCGFYRNGDSIIRLQHFRLRWLDEVIESIQPTEPVVIWAKYHYCIDQIHSRLTKNYGSKAVAQFHGGLSEASRNKELERWHSGARFLIATQAAGGHGLDLTHASYSIFYANGFKYSDRIQAEDRFHRIGQTRPVNYINIWAEAKIEDRIAGAIATKGNALRRFREEVDKIKANRKENLKRLLETV